MNKIYSKFNLERLRLQHSQLDTIKLDSKLSQYVQGSEMKRGTGKNTIRKVFGIDEQSKHEYDIYEKQQLEAFKKLLDYENQFLQDELILRFLYANQFDFDTTIQVKITLQKNKHMRLHHQWITNPSNFRWTLNAEEIIVRNRSIYQEIRCNIYKWERFGFQANRCDKCGQTGYVYLPD
ncbi:unnamed protein product (macronuclear) [Paramecium tetraurelia]|uniref:Uncharacterized protein n=1 Tax=Paramecium tetraurelia TaxID=5888 RepID=A0CBE2_PARTE|nr:uncharacterized protein GSPATT00036892001 [Paramecium tetraurelia]CAK68109.1 unnamed protein product [Paramecium tetraurelia]|eukprot:XP_001435506.1 hypothetical protein (macronuclear) [Paramecium tetraurelia strain d4-2]